MWQTTLVCLHCGMGKEMCDLTSTQVAGYCFQHLRTHKDNQCDEAPLSLVTKLVPSWSGLKEGERTPQQPCPVIWDAKVVDEWFSDAVKATFVEREVHICMNCLRIRKPKLVCCKDMEIKRMNGKKVLGSHATLIMDSPQLQLQASLARIEARSRRAVIEDMPLRANSPSASTPDVTLTVGSGVTASKDDAVLLAGAYGDDDHTGSAMIFSGPPTIPASPLTVSPTSTPSPTSSTMSTGVSSPLMLISALFTCVSVLAA